MRNIILTFAILFNINVLAGALDGFTISKARGNFATAFLVTGGQGLSSFEVQRVYKKIGTFKVSGGFVEMPNSTYDNYGWRGPSHVLVITHAQKDFALNKIQSDDMSKFEDPTYSNPSERVAPTAGNIKYMDRKAILLKKVRRASEFKF